MTTDGLGFDSDRLTIGNYKGSVNKLHSFLREMGEMEEMKGKDNSEMTFIIDGRSCSIQQHESDIVQVEPKIRLKRLIVYASTMTLRSLQALLAPLAVSKVTLQQSIILEEGRENNEFTEPREVMLGSYIYIYIYIVLPRCIAPGYHANPALCQAK